MRSRTVATLFFTYASGVLISCATPATSWPSEDIFSVWTSWASDSRSCARVVSSSLVRSATRASSSSLARLSSAWVETTRSPRYPMPISSAVA
jgi:hypothetical protein